MIIKLNIKILILVSTSYKFNINKSFFSLFDKSEITDAEIEANVILNKKDHRDSLCIEFSGNINNLLCDSCSSKISLPISSTNRIN